MLVYVRRGWAAAHPPPNPPEPPLLNIFWKIICKNKLHRLLTKVCDYRHLQLAKFTVQGEESDIQLKNNQFRCPGAENQEKLFLKSYAHIEIAVALIVNFVVFWVIARNPPERFWRKLVEVLPFILPDLPKTSRTSKNHRKQKILRPKLLEKTEIVNDDVHVNVIILLSTSCLTLFCLYLG